MGPNAQYVCYPSEGGHKEWAPRGAGSDMTQVELLKHLKIKFAGWNRCVRLNDACELHASHPCV